MKTLYLKADDPAAVCTAAKILRDGGLVALPTETVYGLAANALNPEAVAKIFAAKGRPQDNPLIVHIASTDSVAPLVEKVDERLPLLAERFWPGPLTVIMKKSALVPDAVTAGLPTVAIRMPSHPAARAIIKECGLPLAAPSANTSGRPSPASAGYVLADLDGKIDAVVDGGECEVGVESTVLSLAGEVPVILRPGGVTPDELREVLGEVEISPAVFSALGQGEKPQSPGMKYKHYAPRAAVTVIKGNFDKYKAFLDAQNTDVCAVCFYGEGKYFSRFVEYGGKNDSASQAKHLFDSLRKVDEMGCDAAFVRCPDTDGVGLAVYNRLLRSAAFRVIDLDISIPVYGLTGQTGAGKTTVGRLLEEKGMKVIDTDLLARKAVENPDVLSRLTAHFGEDILKDGKLDRRALARRAFANEEDTKFLNSVTHPEIVRLTVEEIHSAEKAGAKAAVIDAPVLFESALPCVCDRVICVTADEDKRLERIIKRDGLSVGDAKKRMGAQKDEADYISRSDIIIENNDLDLMKAQVNKIFS